LGKIQSAVRIGELHLVLQIVVCKKIIPRVDFGWWPVVRGESRHLWQQVSTKGIIRWCRIWMLMVTTVGGG